MSVKFEKDTIQQTGGGVGGMQGPTMMKEKKRPIADEIGTALTGGKANVGTKGYLAVSLVNFLLSKGSALTNTIRPISTSFRRTLCGRRCLQQEVYRLRKNFLPLGSLRIGIRMGAISHLESPRWPRMVHLSALLWATSLSVYFRECLLAAPA